MESIEGSCPMKVSIIIPTWNRESTIMKAVKSALNQDYGELEILVCDDGSTDSTEELVTSIKDHRVRWIPGARGGRPAIPRNRGIRKAKGEWIAFLDSDDVWISEKLGRQISEAKESGVKAVCVNAFRYVPSTGRVGNLLSWNLPKVTFEDLLTENVVICSSVLLHRSILEIAGGFPEKEELTGCEDYALWLRVATITDFAYIDEPLLEYRDDPRSSIRSEGAGEHTQKRRVLSNFLEWGRNMKIEKSIMKKARERHRESSIKEGKERIKSLFR